MSTSISAKGEAGETARPLGTVACVMLSALQPY
jgi:hypothetical protein